MEEETQTRSSPMNYYQEPTSSVIEIRLNTERFLEQMELDLRQETFEEITSEETGHTKIIKKKNDNVNPLANEMGIRAIMSFIRSFVNPQVVQGNIGESQYNEVVRRLHHGINELLFYNFKDFGLTVMSYQLIMETFPSKIELFLSRLIDNKERDSYNQMRIIEQLSTMQGKEKNMLGLKN